MDLIRLEGQMHLNNIEEGSGEESVKSTCLLNLTSAIRNQAKELLRGKLPGFQDVQGWSGLWDWCCELFHGSSSPNPNNARNKLPPSFWILVPLRLVF